MWKKNILTNSKFFCTDMRIRFTIYWQDFLYWHTHQKSLFASTKWKITYWLPTCFCTGAEQIVNILISNYILASTSNFVICQYIQTTDYTGKICLFYTGTEQYFNHTGKTEYTRFPTVCLLPCDHARRGPAARQTILYSSVMFTAWGVVFIVKTHD